jgi:hypothetical protein
LIPGPMRGRWVPVQAPTASPILRRRPNSDHWNGCTRSGRAPPRADCLTGTRWARVPGPAQIRAGSRWVPADRRAERPGSRRRCKPPTSRPLANWKKIKQE